MKLNKYIGLAAFAVAFSACQEDLLENNKQQGGIYTLSGKMVGGAVMSRAQIDLDNTDKTKESFMWNEGDAITLYQEIDGDHTEHVFRINNYSETGDGDKKVASFVTDNPAAVGTAVAFYPSGLTTDFDGDSKRVSLQLQTTVDFSTGSVEEVWKDYFNNNMLMRAQATLTENNENTLEFEHLLSLARITYQNESGKDQQVTEIKLGGDQHYGYAPTVWLDFGWVGGMFNNGYGITYKNLTVKAGESFDFYILFGPDKFDDGDMHIHIHTAQTDGNRSPLVLPTSTIAAANNGAEGFEAGKRYWFKVTETASGLIWTNNQSQETKIQLAAKNGGEFTVTERIRLTAPLIVEKDLNLHFNDGAAFDGDIGQFVDSEGLKAMVVVKPGAALTINGNGEINTGHMDTQLSCIRMIGGSDEPSKVVINSGMLIGTHHVILVDEDCQNAQVEINGGSLSSDWSMVTNNYNGSAILNKSDAQVVIKGGQISSSASAVEMWGGQFTMTNGTLEASYQGEKSHVDTNGVADNCIVGSALALYPSEGNTVTASISNGTFQGISSVYEIHAGEGAESSLSITGGTFEGAINSYNCTRFISGGRYKVQPNANYMVNGKIAVSTGDYYEIQDGEPSSDLITIQNTEFSTALQAVLGAENVKLENGYAVMTKEFVESVETIEIPSGQYTITSLSGIENFINLKRLECARTGLTECNLSKNTKLESVAVWGNSLTTLDLSNQASLFDINCAQNETLQTLNINANVRLKYLIIDDTNLQSLVIPNPETIWQLAYSRTPLNLDLSKFTGLEILFCSGNKLTTINLNLKTKQKLTNLECDSNSLTSLDLKEYPNLERLICWQNLLETLDITPLNNLRDLVCGNQQNDIVLQLQLTDDQKTKWESTWSTNRNNNNVRTPEDSIVEPNNGNTNGNNFWFEEL